MPAALTKSEHVRRILQQNFTMPAGEVQERLDRKGFSVETSLVHTVRSKMKKEKLSAEQQEEEEKRLAEVQEIQDAELRDKAKKARVAKMQQTKSRNTKPLREHILDALYHAGRNHDEGMTIADIIQRCQVTYSYPPVDEDNFKQNVRKKLRLLVLNGDVVNVLMPSGQRNNDKFELAHAPSDVKPVAKKVDSVVKTEENGIAFLVAKLKEVVTKIGKNETKELIDVL